MHKFESIAIDRSNLTQLSLSLHTMKKHKSITNDDNDDQHLIIRVKYDFWAISKMKDSKCAL